MYTATVTEDPNQAGVPREFVDNLGLLLSEYPTRRLRDSDAVTVHAVEALGCSSQDARDLVMRELEGLLSDPDLDDGYLIAAGWLLAFRSARPADVARDIVARDGDPIISALERGAPDNKSLRREVAYFVLKRRTERWRADFLEKPRTGFQAKNGKVGPRTRDIASVLAPLLFSRLQEARATAAPGAPDVREDNHAHPKLFGRKAVVAAAAIVLAGGIGGAIVQQISARTSEQIVESQPAAVASSPPSTPLDTPSPASPLPALPKSTPLQSGSCPPPHGETVAEAVDVEVFYWCTGFSYLRDGLPAPDQYQLKVRLGLRNTSDLPVSISIQNPSAIRLLVRETDVAARWQAPPATFDAGDRPVQVIIDSETYWAIPPNQPGDAIYGADGGLTFASYWDNPTDLEPGASIGSSTIGGGVVASERGAIDTDVVFEVPGPYGSSTDTYGIGVFDVTAGLDQSAKWRLIGACKMIDHCMNASNQMPANLF